MSDVTNSVNAEGVFEPFDMARVPWVEFPRGEGALTLRLGEGVSLDRSAS